MFSRKFFRISRRCYSLNHNSNSPAPFYDVVIVGGGLVGNAMACSLGMKQELKGQKVLLMDAGKNSSLKTIPPINFPNRVSAVNPGSVKLFKELGIWDTLKNYRMRKISDLYVVDGCSQSSIRFEQLNSEEPIGYIIENEAVSSALYDQITKKCLNVTIMPECNVEYCRIPDDLSETAEIQTSEQKIRTNLLIGADGVGSNVRKAMTANYTTWKYDQMTIVGTLNVNSSEKNTIAWQRFTPLGPVGILPLTDELSSLAWTTSTEDARRLLALPPDEFVDELNHYLSSQNTQSDYSNKALFLMDKFVEYLPGFGRVAGKPKLQLPYIIELHKPDSRAAFPLAFGHTHDYVKNRVALVGDAAHRIHPLAGQGVNLGWYDVRSLTKTLCKAVNEGGDIGSLTYLSEYDTDSQRHNVPIMLAIDGLNRLYSTNFEPLVFLRSIGCNTLDKLLPIKDLLVRQASR